MSKNLLFVINPASGKAQLRNSIITIIDTFIKSGFSVRVHTTQSPGDAHNVILAEGGNYDLIAVAGGDGTLSEAVSAVLTLDNMPPIGYIPSGSTNDFANSLGLPKSFDKAAEVIMTGEPFACDIGRFNDRTFNYVAAFGAFTDVSYETPQETKNMFGHLAYIFEGMSRLPNLPNYDMKIQLDDETIEGNFAIGMTMNSNFVGGINGDKIVKADLSDGMFEVLLIKNTSNIFEYQPIIAGLLKGEEEGKNFVLKKVRRAVFDTDDDSIKWTLDGEFGGNDKHAEMTVLEHAVNIIVPKGTDK